MTIIPRPVPILELSPRHGWVYFIKSDSGHYKIGKSRRPDKRVGEFTLQLPFKVEVIHLVESDDYHLAERMFHIMFRDYHVNGEWFLLSKACIDIILQYSVIHAVHISDMIETNGAPDYENGPSLIYKITHNGANYPGQIIAQQEARQ